jgi:hypothetical protein
MARRGRLLIFSGELNVEIINGDRPVVTIKSMKEGEQVYRIDAHGPCLCGTCEFVKSVCAIEKYTCECAICAIRDISTIGAFSYTNPASVEHYTTQAPPTQFLREVALLQDSCNHPNQSIVGIYACNGATISISKKRMHKAAFVLCGSTTSLTLIDGAPTRMSCALVAQAKLLIPAKNAEPSQFACLRFVDTPVSCFKPEKFFAGLAVFGFDIAADSLQDQNWFMSKATIGYRMLGFSNYRWGNVNHWTPGRWTEGFGVMRSKLKTAREELARDVRQLVEEAVPAAAAGHRRRDEEEEEKKEETKRPRNIELPPFIADCSKQVNINTLDGGADECLFCMDYVRNHAATPCGHVVYCGECVSKYRTALCPLCKRKVEAYVPAHVIRNTKLFD